LRLSVTLGPYSRPRSIATLGCSVIGRLTVCVPRQHLTVGIVMANVKPYSQYNRSFNNSGSSVSSWYRRCAVCQSAWL